jgi:hypothetical protein
VLYFPCARFWLSTDQWNLQGGFDDLIVVGAVDTTGHWRRVGNGPRGVDVYAPGVSFSCSIMD